MSATLSARVRVPATSANLGAGFDCIGMAVERWLTASVNVHGGIALRDGGQREGENVITVARGGTLATLDVAPAEDALVVGFLAGCAARARPVPAQLAFAVDSEIPFARGLGSSSAALVAGVQLANVSLGLALTRNEIAALCTEIEGHPDNVAPAVFGGLVLAVPDEAAAGGWVFRPLPVSEDLAFAFIVPAFLIETARARAALPAALRHAIAVRAAGKAAALVHGLATGDASLLRVALDDVLHVPYREALVPAMARVHAAACGAGAFGLTLSGSGSTLVAIAPPSAADRVAAAMQAAWRAEGIAAETFVQRRPALAEPHEK